MRNGPTESPIPIGQPAPLTADDLERLREPRFVATSPQKLRDSHHMIARLAASGKRPGEIAALVGYSRERVTVLLLSPAMEELVAVYRAKVDEAFVESQDAFFELATRNMLAAERHIADHIAELDESGELLPVRTALAISRDAADRFGYGKKTQNLNINVDFASQLERAIKRSGKGPALEGTTTTVAQTPAPRRQLAPPSSPRQNSQSEKAAGRTGDGRKRTAHASTASHQSPSLDAPQPRILRRA